MRNQWPGAKETPLKGKTSSKTGTRSGSGGGLGSLNEAFVSLAAASTGLVDGDVVEGSDGDLSDDEEEEEEEEEEEGATTGDADGDRKEFLGGNDKISR